METCLSRPVEPIMFEPNQPRSLPRRRAQASLLCGFCTALMLSASAAAFLVPAHDARAQGRLPAIDLVDGTGWVSTDRPLTLKDLRGKIVVLEFWTECCINCMHVFPDLIKLEKKYPNQLVVIGVHTPKFDHEKGLDVVRRAVKRYGLPHPVVNDSDRKLWQAYNVQFWPTVVVIDPEGYVVQGIAQENVYDKLDSIISGLIKVHRARKTLDEDGPSRFGKDKADDSASPLSFPGKVLADEASKRLFIADSTNHRIVITDLVGRKIAIAGTGVEGQTDGAFDKATFNEPQGMALYDDTLYVADRKNHLIRALDLKANTVKTVAGTGKRALWPPRKEHMNGGLPRNIPLNSPWDVLVVGTKLYIAMAGHHQIWMMSLTTPNLTWVAGNAQEEIVDGFRSKASFAQPSGLTSDGKVLYIADSETSAIRAITLNPPGPVRTLVGLGLFQFGDMDGIGPAVRLQHPIGVTYHKGKLFVVDTYNDKIKVLDPLTRECITFVGGSKTGLFSEPSGSSYAQGKLYVADTNNHRIQVVALGSRDVTTLELQDVEPPQRPAPKQR
jgi:thiol-disulfide isomerase/thioredoxin